MKPIDGAAVPLPEPVPAAAQSCRKSDVVRQHAHFQHALSICSAPIQTRACFEACLGNNLGRNGYLIFSRYSSDHGKNLFLEK
ncbi:MAG: hypothetical protein ABSF77_00575 [Spirochaetia bacterium]|jgi:hypothetical protein